jgi:hypothetical protein
MTPPIDPDTLARLRVHIAAVAIATAATSTAGCKKEQPTMNNPMPHTMNEPAQPTPNTAAIPQPTAQEQAGLPRGRTAGAQDMNEPANAPAALPEAGATATSDAASAAPPPPPPPPQEASPNEPASPRPTINLPPPDRRRTPPGNG